MSINGINLARVSTLLSQRVATQNIGTTQESLLNVQNQISSGLKFTTPGESPADAAVAIQLKKTLQTREAYATNLREAQNNLGAADTSLSDLTDLLQQAQTLASQNVGSDVSPDARKAAAEVAKSLYRQAVTVGNKEVAGTFLFGGDKATTAPFVESLNGVEFIGSDTTLKNRYEDNVDLSFQVDGNEVFGALSTRVTGTADLTPSLAVDTRISDLRGATGDTVRKGTIQLGNGSTTANIDLTSADTLGDVVSAINNAAVGGITASLNGNGLKLTGAAGDNITVVDLGGGSTAGDLGIAKTVGGGAGVDLVGLNTQPKISELTTLASLNNGAGIDLASGIKITNGIVTDTLTFTGSTTVGDLLNGINSSKTGAKAEINAAGTGINIVNPIQGAAITIAENGGTTAADLGVRSFSPATELAELNNGAGVRGVDGDDFKITDSNGVTFAVDLNGATTVQDALNKINAAATTAGAGVTAGFKTTDNGITLLDTAGGGSPLKIVASNGSDAVTDLGLTQPVVGTIINGKDVNSVEAAGVFANIGKLRDALIHNDQDGITKAAEALQIDQQRVIQTRGQVGARVQEFDARSAQLEDDNLATKSLLSQVQDTDMTEAISKFTALQTSLQAAYQTASKTLNLSLLDFLR